MAITAHALKIESDDGNGDLVNYTNSALGFEDGIAYLITGRYGLDGSKTISADSDTDRDTWYEGILTKDFAPSPSRTADFTEAGCVTANSTLQFSVVEKNAFRATLAANEIYLNRCRATYYYVESEDGEEFTFYQMWTGVIDDQPFTETRNQANCIDNSKDIFTSLPPDTVDGNNFPDAEPQSKSEQIPISVGRIALSRLVNVETAGEYVALTGIDDEDGYVAAATNYSSGDRWIDLYTLDKAFSADAASLVGMFLVVVLGGADQSIRITSNSATSASVTRVYLDDAWTGAITIWDAGSSSQDIWYFKVKRYSAVYLSSSKTVSEFIENEAGQPAIYTYDSETKRFVDISELRVIYNLSGIKAFGRPGLEAIVRRFETDGEISAYLPIRSTGIELVSTSSIPGGSPSYSGPGVGSPQPDLLDQDQASGYLLTDNMSEGDIYFDVDIPPEDFRKSFDAVYLLVDLLVRRTSGSGSETGVVQLSAQGIDIYGRITDEIFEDSTVYFSADDGGALTTTAVEVYLLHGTYYNEPESPAKFFSKKSLLDISSLISNTAKTGAYNRVRLRIWAGLSGTIPFELDIREIGFVGEKTVSLVNDDLYHSIKGETFGTRWRSPDATSVNRKTAADPILHIGDGLEHLIRNYDYDHPVWQAGQAYVAGLRVRSTVDNGWIYICTVAGTSDASEPTFPTDLGDTVTDGTVTWKALDTLKIHCGSFDTLADQRPWPIGRSIRDKKPSIDYYKEMARQGFFILLTDAQGRAKVKAWRENTTALTTFDSSNVVGGSFGPVTPTPSRKCYNDFLIRYDENPATGSFNKQVGITRVHEPAFPAESDAINPGTPVAFTVILREPSTFDGYDYQFLITTAADHGFTLNSFVSLTGNTDGFDFSVRQVLGLGDDPAKFLVGGHLTPGVGTMTPDGTLKSHPDSRLKWKSFAPGIQSYAFAKSLWEQARRGYVVTKTVNKLPQDIGDCRWFPDPEATTPGGSRIWPDLAGGDDHPAVYLLQNLVEWCPLPKEQVTFEVGHAAARVAVAAESVTRYLEEGDCVAVNDAKLTGGAAKTGWIHEFTLIPGSDKRPDRIRIGVTLNPDTLEVADIIDENGADAADIIDENGAAAGDIIDEN